MQSSQQGSLSPFICASLKCLGSMKLFTQVCLTNPLTCSKAMFTSLFFKHPEQQLGPRTSSAFSEDSPTKLCTRKPKIHQQNFVLEKAAAAQY